MDPVSSFNAKHNDETSQWLGRSCFTDGRPDHCPSPRGLDCIRHILGCRLQDRLPCAALRHRLHLRALSPVLLQRNHSRGHQPGASSLLAKKRGGQLKTWMNPLKEDLAHLSRPDVFGLRRWNRDWMPIGIAWAQESLAEAAAVRDAFVAVDASATAPR